MVRNVDFQIGNEEHARLQEEATTGLKIVVYNDIIKIRSLKKTAALFSSSPLGWTR